MASKYDNSIYVTGQRYWGAQFPIGTALSTILEHLQHSQLVVH